MARSKKMPGPVEEIAGTIDSRLLPILLTVARDMNSEKDVDRLLEYIPAHIAEMTGSERCTLFLLDREKNELWSRVATGAAREIRVKVGEGIAGHVAATGEVLNIGDAYGDKRFTPDVDRATGFTTRSLLCAPLRNLQGEVLGVFQLLNKRDGTFNERDAEFLALFGSHAAVALEGARLNRENREAIRKLTEAQAQLKEQIRRTEVLYRIEQEANKSGDFEGILASVITLSSEALGAEAGSILLIDGAQSGRLFFHYSYGEKADALRRISISSQEGIAGWVLGNRKATLSNDPVHDSRFNKTFADSLSFAVRNIMAAPLISSGKVLGVLEILNHTARDFEEADLTTLEFIASQVSGTLEKKLLFEQSQKAQRLASVGDMASRIIHDFKNPMTVIKGITQLFQEGELPAEKRDKYAGMMLREIDRCVEMTQEILDFARGDTRYRFCRVTLAEVLGDCLPLIEKDSSQRGIVLKTDVPPALTFNADPSRLKRVLFNLCRNALEAQKNKGELSIAAKAADGGVEIRIADRGPGIAPEIRDRLFEPFATHGKPNGTGLGLAIAKSVADAHGGRITIDAAHSPGTCFVVWLPEEPPGA